MRRSEIFTHAVDAFLVGTRNVSHERKKRTQRRRDCAELGKSRETARIRSLPRAGSPQAGAARRRTASDECVKFSERRMRFSVVYIASRTSMFVRQRKIHIDARFGLDAVVGPLVLGDM
jgi:hypothetical protein